MKFTTDEMLLAAELRRLAIQRATAVVPDGLTDAEFDSWQQNNPPEAFMPWAVKELEAICGKFIRPPQGK